MRRSEHWLFSIARINRGLVRFDEHRVCSVSRHPRARHSNAAAWYPRGLAALRSEMAACQADGARLGWLLIPHQQAEEVWPPMAFPVLSFDRRFPAFEGVEQLSSG
jgi:hypothetical protein